MTYRQIMWRHSWVNIQMMLADAPKMIKRKELPTTLTGDGFRAIFGSESKK